MADKNAYEWIRDGQATLGIECGSTRIKAILIGPDHSVLAAGGHTWENTLVDGLWSYSLTEVHEGVQHAYATLVADVNEKYGLTPTCYTSIGISAMMHGYLAFDAQKKQLVPFRTWRNVSTGPAAAQLSELFGINIPMRWSIAHLHQAVLNNEEHVARIASINTLAGYVHELLTGQHVLGIGDASGMFPIDSRTYTYDERCLDAYDTLMAGEPYTWKLRDLLPQVLVAGQDAGKLTKSGALLLDPTGQLQAGIQMCPPEGDAGTGMVATHAVAPRTGNVSAGTSIFAMIVLEKALTRLHMEVDPVTTPDGSPVAMVHSNNGASELDVWAKVFAQFSEYAGIHMSMEDIYTLLYTRALSGAPDGGGLLAYNLLSGEPVIGVDAGRPLLMRLPDADFSLADLMRTQLMTVFAPIRMGMNILTDEGVELDRLLAHGGIFKTAGVAQKILADALRTPIAVGETAGEGGAWGIAVLARYAAVRAENQTLLEYLDNDVFVDEDVTVIEPHEADADAYESYLSRYMRGTAITRTAAQYS
ncbi:xylulokinase [Schaalia sp. lx-260]|uniref:xylulokinase n=1 Tax=Schaalia sp. lx-260 TaxID=2899082 RepID=UPI001E455A35|nr:ATPase [Schaalia sp. lx-260]